MLVLVFVAAKTLTSLLAPVELLTVQPCTLLLIYSFLPCFLPFCFLLLALAVFCL